MVFKFVFVLKTSMVNEDFELVMTYPVVDVGFLLFLLLLLLRFRFQYHNIK